MAIRKIRTIGDEILGHNTKPVKLITPRTALLIGDMLDTMYRCIRRRKQPPGTYKS